jgi:glycosyltransferase involved in cell wall biosynthesis
MKLTLSCIGKFHHFDLARQLDQSGWLDKIYTSYPRWKLKSERLPQIKIDTFPWFQSIYMSQGRWPVRSAGLSRLLARFAIKAHDSHVARMLRPCDAFVGLSGHNFMAGKRARALGARWVCDHGSSHISYHATILREEHARWGVPFLGVPDWDIDQHLAEYDACDAITISSRFAERTFLEAGVSPDKLRRVAYGVDLSRFYPVARPENGRFDVVFVGGVTVRKGIPYLIEAFRKLRHPRKSLKIIGGLDSAFAPWLQTVRVKGVEYMGALPQVKLKEHLSRSHLFVLPSVEEGLALVQAQAMACACPLLCSENTGGGDLITSGVEGFVVPIRDANAMADRMQQLVDDPQQREKMSQAALFRVKSLGGWDDYGRAYKRVLNDLIGLSSG